MKSGLLGAARLLADAGAVSIMRCEGTLLVGVFGMNYRIYELLGGQASVDGGSSFGTEPPTWKKSCDIMSSSEGLRAGSLCRILVIKLFD